MNKVRFHYAYPIDIDIDTEKNVDVYIDQFPMTSVIPGALSIVILEEPGNDSIASVAQRYTDNYTHLLTFRQELLDTNPKARLFLCMNTWVRNYVSLNKKFCVSTVVGGKKDSRFHGYALRHELWDSKELITIPKNFYLSGNAPYKHIFIPWTEVDYTNQLVLGDSKLPLFDSMFHIAIENISMRNYFSEKILDCFQSRTVPIYIGCTNIGDFFNIDGIIVVKNGREIVDACNKLTIDDYIKRLPAMVDNFNRSLKWCDHPEQIKIGVTKILNE